MARRQPWEVRRRGAADYRQSTGKQRLRIKTTRLGCFSQWALSWQGATTKPLPVCATPFACAPASCGRSDMRLDRSRRLTACRRPLTLRPPGPPRSRALKGDGRGRTEGGSGGGGFVSCAFLRRPGSRFLKVQNVERHPAVCRVFNRWTIKVVKRGRNPVSRFERRSDFGVELNKVIVTTFGHLSQRVKTEVKLDWAGLDWTDCVGLGCTNRSRSSSRFAYWYLMVN